MPNIERLRNLNTARWIKAKINKDQAPNFMSVAERLVAAKDRYQAVSLKTGVPWWFIAVVHEREASQDWSRSLAQGDPWNKVSTHVPKGRGPFDSWEDAAVDALVHCAPFAADNKDWSVGGSLTMLEEYNGMGYSHRGIPSPYIWAGTNEYISGKYVRDGVFDPHFVDRQLGCAGLLLAMKSIDPTVLGGTVSEPVPLSIPKSILPVDTIQPLKPSLFSTIMAFFRRK